MADLDALLARVEDLLARAERWLPPVASPDWSAVAWRWRRQGRQGVLEPIRRPHRLLLSDLCCIEQQRAEIDRNTRQFLAGQGANNVLLWGSRGTGKSSLIKALLTTYQGVGLRVIEVDKDDLTDLPAILELIDGRPERFLCYCDDLSFDAGESGYQALKAALDGSLCAPPDNLLIYATSNRRHLLPEYQSENREARVVDGEVHQGEGVEEKISLSDRFGLWLSFHPFTQQQYLTVCRHWLGRLGVPAPTDDAGREALERAALQWALRRGSRSGRTAWQFARDQAGRQGGAAGPAPRDDRAA